MKKVAAQSVKMARAVTAKTARPVKSVKPKILKAKAEMNTEALEMPHRVPGKPHNYRYK